MSTYFYFFSITPPHCFANTGGGGLFMVPKRVSFLLVKQVTDIRFCNVRIVNIDKKHNIGNIVVFKYISKSNFDGF